MRDLEKDKVILAGAPRWNEIKGIAYDYIAAYEAAEKENAELRQRIAELEAALRIERDDAEIWDGLAVVKRIDAVLSKSNQGEETKR